MKRHEKLSEAVRWIEPTASAVEVCDQFWLLYRGGPDTWEAYPTEAAALASIVARIEARYARAKAAICASEAEGWPHDLGDPANLELLLRDRESAWCNLCFAKRIAEGEPDGAAVATPEQIAAAKGGAA